MSETPADLTSASTLVDHIPVLWCAPTSRLPKARLVI